VGPKEKKEIKELQAMATPSKHQASTPHKRERRPNFELPSK
jgi:hypothetical protein